MSRVFGLTLATLATASLGYCLYFDYSRRHNVQFRKNLQKQKKRALNKAKAEGELDKTRKMELLKEKLNQSLVEEPLPTSLAEKEQFFMSQVTLGEKLSELPGAEIDAAIYFYKGLAVYPQPTTILEIYQRTVPAHVYELVMMLTAIQPPQSVINILGDSAASIEPEIDEE
ncbi:hypothetical protein CANARDRAFT_30540 [[Candida] arabinofermentans NRRL YB-2248]|uniref:Mitochondrial import receptor subunit TOM20 n=1 Tax=[Candida] arabinofermentans NRRL YB-2248 TaxID=983967 RepID=A0A1E4STL5_9ASCO|nr:hypothetical protein CANARDRAFT_30540 [[Candida] arabinofermentans NRRL YB-2248]